MPHRVRQSTVLVMQRGEVQPRFRVLDDRVRVVVAALDGEPVVLYCVSDLAKVEYDTARL